MIGIKYGLSIFYVNVFKKCLECENYRQCFKMLAYSVPVVNFYEPWSCDFYRTVTDALQSTFFSVKNRSFCSEYRFSEEKLFILW